MESNGFRYRSKVWCGKQACQLIIDTRRTAQNQKKKAKKKDKGTFYKGVPPRARHYILKRDGGRCVLCGDGGKHNVQVHHIRPVSDDGTDEHTNLITLCKHDHDMVHLNMNEYSYMLSRMAIRRENEL
jgi:5-methylcytosine-specific restriction endonuclease McrA